MRDPLELQSLNIWKLLLDGPLSMTLRKFHPAVELGNGSRERTEVGISEEWFFWGGTGGVFFA